MGRCDKLVKLGRFERGYWDREWRMGRDDMPSAPNPPLIMGSSGICGASVGWGERLFGEPQRRCGAPSWGSCLTPTYRVSFPKYPEESLRGGTIGGKVLAVIYSAAAAIS